MRRRQASATAIVSALQEAFSLAQPSRRAKGLGAGTADMPPKSYQMTMHWSPADYVDILREMQRRRYPKGFASFVHDCVFTIVPQLAYRPVRWKKQQEQAKASRARGRVAA